MLRVWQRTTVHFMALRKLARMVRRLPDNAEDIARVDAELANVTGVLGEVAAEARGLRKLEQLLEARDRERLWRFVESMHELMKRWKVGTAFSDLLEWFPAKVVERLADDIGVDVEALRTADAAGELVSTRKVHGAKQAAVLLAASLLKVDARTIYRHLKTVPKEQRMSFVLNPPGALRVPRRDDKRGDR